MGEIQAADTVSPVPIRILIIRSVSNVYIGILFLKEDLGILAALR